MYRKCELNGTSNKIKYKYLLKYKRNVSFDEERH